MGSLTFCAAVVRVKFFHANSIQAVHNLVIISCDEPAAAVIISSYQYKQA
jgi:hypothetical protein